MTVSESSTLRDQTALVTGAGSGLGRQFARCLAAAGATVILGGRRREPLEQVAAEIRAARGDGAAHCVEIDIADPASVDAAVGAIDAIGAVDVLVNNAGIGVAKSLAETTLDDWQRVMDTNLRGAWLLSRAVVERMASSGHGGSIINVSSILGTAVQKGSGVYAASKAALDHMTRLMAVEWARHGVRVNAIDPGFFYTEASGPFLESERGRALLKRIPLRRLGNLPDLDGALLLLASRASSYMTGTTLVVDGGLSLPVI